MTNHLTSCFLFCAHYHYKCLDQLLIETDAFVARGGHLSWVKSQGAKQKNVNHYRRSWGGINIIISCLKSLNISLKRLWSDWEIHRSLRVNKMDQRRYDFEENLLKSFMFHQNKVLNDTIYNSFPGVRSFFHNYTLEPKVWGRPVWRCKAGLSQSSVSIVIKTPTLPERSQSLHFTKLMIIVTSDIIWCTATVRGTRRPPGMTAPSSSWSPIIDREYIRILTRLMDSPDRTGRRVSRVC